MVVANAPKDSGASKLSDDDQVIVVVDSTTGELRECGNLSGYCVGLQPWARPAPQTAPVVLAKHANDVSREAGTASQAK